MPTSIKGNRPVSYEFDISFGFGEKYSASTIKRLGLKNTVHKGTDFKTPLITPVRPFLKGKVVRVQDDGNKGWGKWIAVYSEDKSSECVHYYCHLSGIKVKVGDIVTEDMVIGFTGESGCAAGHPHLHFELRTLAQEAILPTFRDS